MSSKSSSHLEDLNSKYPEYKYLRDQALCHPGEYPAREKCYIGLLTINSS